MSKLPRISGTEAIKAFRRFGWQKVRQRGSHVTRAKAGTQLVLTVPLHFELDRGTLCRLIRDAGISVDEFLAAV